MANTKNKKADVDTSVEQETVAKTAPEKAPRKFAMDDPILCKSVTFGELLLPGKKSQLLYTWANYGDTTEVEFQDLQALRSTRSAYLNAPYFVIEDEELLEQWPEFKTLYEKVAAIDVDNLFNLPINQFKKRLREIPVGFKDSIKNIASDKILNGSLDSLTKINALDEILGTDLKLLIQ
jgi:hypothetical protein